MAESRIWIDEPCPACEGAGWLSEQAVRERWPHLTMASGRDQQPCPRCHGNRYLPRRITLTALATLLAQLRLDLLEHPTQNGEETTQP